jgi:hypothetical protein
MKQILFFQHKKIPVFMEQHNPKALSLLKTTLDKKLTKGKKAMVRCLNTLISIELKGREAIFHAMNEKDTLVVSIY